MISICQHIWKIIQKPHELARLIDVHINRVQAFTPAVQVVLEGATADF